MSQKSSSSIPQKIKKRNTFRASLDFPVMSSEIHSAGKIKLSKSIRYVAVAEGVSYLLLLILSILKRTTTIDVHLGIKYLGMAHGVLFVLFVTAIVLGKIYLKWTMGRSIWAFVASLLPFGTFVLDAQLKKEEDLMQ